MHKVNAESHSLVSLTDKHGWSTCAPLRARLEGALLNDRQQFKSWDAKTLEWN